LKWMQTSSLVLESSSLARHNGYMDESDKENMACSTRSCATSESFSKHRKESDKATMTMEINRDVHER
jgi:hypothetical protein